MYSVDVLLNDLLSTTKLFFCLCVTLAYFVNVLLNRHAKWSTINNKDILLLVYNFSVYYECAIEQTC